MGANDQSQTQAAASAGPGDRLSPQDVPGALYFFASGALCALNDAARTLLGFDARASLPQIERALDPERQLRERLRAAATGQPRSPLRLSSRRRGGELLCLELHVASCTAGWAAQSAAPGRFVVLAHDCSQWLDMEDQLHRRLAFERLMTEASATLIRSGNDGLDAAIVDVLGSVGGFFGVDRAYVFLFDEVAATQSNTHEWVAAGISREAHNLQDIPMTTFPWLLAQMRADRVFQVGRIADMPAEAVNERAEFEREGIQSILIVPLWCGADLHGFVGFDSVRRQIDWGGHYVIGLRLMAQMLASVLEARVLSLRLHEQAFHDALTGLPNRKLLEDRFEQALKRLHRDGGSVLLAVVDVDDFKRINDNHGHAAGDLLLCKVGRRLRAAVRDTDTVARMGGDEFVVVTHGSGESSLPELAQRLLAVGDAPVELDQVRAQLGLSIGLARASSSQCSFDSLLRGADAAMYRAKSEGKHRWVEAGDTGLSQDRATPG